VPFPTLLQSFCTALLLVRSFSRMLTEPPPAVEEESREKIIRISEMSLNTKLIKIETRPSWVRVWLENAKRKWASRYSLETIANAV